MSSSTTDTKSTVGRRARRFGRKLLIIVIVAFIAVMLFFYYGSYSTGVRAGVVLKISERGAIFKTIEGQLDLQSFGAVESNNQLSQTFEFSVDGGHEEIAKILEEVALTGERVRLRYEEKYAILPWRGETTYFVVAVERAPNPAVPDRNNDRFPQ